MATRTVAFRVQPGQDLKRALVEVAERDRIAAGYVLTCVGSLSRLALRLAGATEVGTWEAPFEIVSLVGTLGPDGVHLHLAASDGAGRVVGGHLVAGCLVRTTAEVVIADDRGHRFGRVHDPATGYDELVVEAGEGTR